MNYSLPEINFGLSMSRQYLRQTGILLIYFGRILNM